MSKSRKYEYIQPSEMVSMDPKSVKNAFKIIQKLLRITFETTDIIFDHFGDLAAKVERCVPVQVIRMLI